MAAKTTTKDLAKTDTQAMVAEFQRRAAAGEMTAAQMDAVADAFGLKMVSKGSERSGTRMAKVREWLSPKKLEGEDLEAVKSLPEKLGSAPLLDSPRTLTQDEVDSIVEEIVPLRQTQDILKGRHEAFRDTVFAAITEANGGDETISGKLVSVKHGYKLEKRVDVTNGKLDVDALKAAIDKKIWTSITRQTRVIDDEALTRAVTDGTISMEIFASVFTPETYIPKFLPAPLKKGEDIK